MTVSQIVCASPIEGLWVLICLFVTQVSFSLSAHKNIAIFRLKGHNFKVYFEREPHWAPFFLPFASYQISLKENLNFHTVVFIEFFYFGVVLCVCHMITWPHDFECTMHILLISIAQICTSCVTNTNIAQAHAMLISATACKQLKWITLWHNALILTWLHIDNLSWIKLFQHWIPEMLPCIWTNTHFCLVFCCSGDAAINPKNKSEWTRQISNQMIRRASYIMEDFTYLIICLFLTGCCHMDMHKSSYNTKCSQSYKNKTQVVILWS